MHISYYTHPGGLLLSTGFGHAGFNIVRSLQKLGNTVSFDNPEADVQLMFTQPPHFKEFDGPCVGYTPWESTEIPGEWYDYFNRCDYFWATSELNKSWYENLGIDVDFVYPHGISDVWTARKRSPLTKKVKFLHVGEPAPRKGGQMVFDAFVELFSDTEHSLTIKSHDQSSIRSTTALGVDRPTIYKNVSLITKDYTEEEMVALFLSHDVLVYPSWGEGFGFIPLQAMATGMPVIFNPTWAPYKNFSVGLDVEDSLAPSPWPLIHPGQMLEPSYESLKSQMIEAVENYGVYSERAWANCPILKEEFSWENQSSRAMKKFVNFV